MSRKEKTINQIITTLLNSASELKQELFDNKRYHLYFASTKSLAKNLELSLQTVRKYCNVIVSIDQKNFKWDKQKGILYYKNYTS